MFHEEKTVYLVLNMKRLLLHLMMQLKFLVMFGSSTCQRLLFVGQHSGIVREMPKGTQINRPCMQKYLLLLFVLGLNLECILIGLVFKVSEMYL